MSNECEKGSDKEKTDSSLSERGGRGRKEGSGDGKEKVLEMGRYKKSITLTDFPFQSHVALCQKFLCVFILLVRTADKFADKHLLEIN